MSDLDGFWANPRPAPITAISPSALNVLLACPKRLGYQRDPKSKYLNRGGTRSALGLAAHKVTEHVEMGMVADSPSSRTEIEEAWAGSVTAQFHSLQEQWPDRSVPPPTAWPGYAVTKVRLIRSLTERVASGQVKTPVTSFGAHTDRKGVPPLPWIEMRLEDPVLGIFGTPDRVDELDGVLRVVDLKSGTRQGGIEAPQARQLRIYAHLVKVVIGRMPLLGVIVDSGGHATELTIEPSAVIADISLAQLKIDEFNVELRSRSVAANPSPENCVWCPFRVRCEDYWQARTPDWNAHGDLYGTIESIDLGASEIEVHSISPELAEISRVIVHEVNGMEPAQKFASTGLRPSGPATYKMMWNSVVRSGAE